MRKFIYTVVLALIVLAANTRPIYAKHAEFIPAQAGLYRARVIREAHAAGGLSAPVPMFAAQMHQESGWNPTATSVVGALGLCQFMPGTAAWIANLAPADLKPAQPLDADWAIRALVRYDYWIAKRLPGYQAGDERWAAALAGYNGGLGWVLKDAKFGKCTAWFGCADSVSDGRSAANLVQNRGYPERILHLLRPLYVTAGWK